MCKEEKGNYSWDQASRREKPVGAAAQYIHIRIFIHNDVYHEGGWRENTEHPSLLLLMKQNIFTVSYALVFSFPYTENLKGGEGHVVFILLSIFRGGWCIIQSQQPCLGGWDQAECGWDLAESGLDLAEGGCDVAESGWDLAESGWDLAECGWNLAKGGWNLAESGCDLAEGEWDLAERGWDLADSGWDLAECGWDLAECGWYLAQFVDEI
jgi:hypothetical protein